VTERLNQRLSRLLFRLCAQQWLRGLSGRISLAPCLAADFSPRFLSLLSFALRPQSAFCGLPFIVRPVLSVFSGILSDSGAPVSS